jgi:Ca-activated chloride channel homolog
VASPTSSTISSSSSSTTGTWNPSRWRAKAALEEFEKAGGGLLWIAGEHNVYVEKKGQPEDALERSLPAKLAPPRSPEGTAVVLIIDKSSSMEGRKIELARLAAIGVVENLRPIDSVGVLIFDNSFQWAVNLRKADDRAAIKRLIAGITPDGGTQIAPALTEAYQKIVRRRRPLTSTSCCSPTASPKRATP